MLLTQSCQNGPECRSVSIRWDSKRGGDQRHERKVDRTLSITVPALGLVYTHLTSIYRIFNLRKEDVAYAISCVAPWISGYRSKE